MTNPTPHQAVAHLVRDWLPRSQTFVHTLVSAQRRYTPFVMATGFSRLDEFPVDRIVELSPSQPLPRRLSRRIRARASGWDTSWEHRLFETTRQGSPALIHAHFGPMGWRALGVRKRLGVPLVTSFYGSDLALPESPGPWRKRYDALFASGDLFVCEGPAMADHLAAIGCPRERIRVVRIGIKLDQFPFHPRSPSSKPVFVQTARFVEKKGLDLSLRAFSAADGMRRGWKLLLIGDGPERPALETLAANLGIEESVSFLGMLSHQEYSSALGQADVALQPSRTASTGDTEGGAPTVLLEMQAAGLPVIASRHADIPFVVADADQLVPENDVTALASAMLTAAERPSNEWPAQAARARDFVTAHHDGNEVARQAEYVYDELAGSSATTESSRSRGRADALATSSSRTGGS